MPDQSIVEAIARRVEPSCPVWRSLASEVGVKVIAILDEPAAAEAAPGQADPAPAPRHSPTQTRQASGRPALPRLSLASLGRLALPKWLTPRMAVLLALALGAFAIAPKPF
jgi:hypothetical protein